MGPPSSARQRHPDAAPGPDRFAPDLPPGIGSNKPVLFGVRLMGQANSSLNVQGVDENNRLAAGPASTNPYGKNRFPHAAGAIVTNRSCQTDQAPLARR